MALHFTPLKLLVGAPEIERYQIIFVRNKSPGRMARLNCHRDASNRSPNTFRATAAPLFFRRGVQTLCVSTNPLIFS